ncbi:Transcription elongation factor [Trema orientale]|uniref:Transcription elongation factor n=1 Tax=Trema orientale TaxID=63057 RepID=A0A2P5E9K0_TREOI|nr:Transcription elongation factor [Trema orientale]
MMFRDGFLYKLVSMRSILAHNIEPTLDELENFKMNGENHFSSFMSFESRKKVHFVKGDKRTIFVNVNELCKYFKHGDRVKVVSGVQKDSTGMVTEIAGHVLGIVCDTTKEVIQVFANDAVRSSERKSTVSMTTRSVHPPKILSKKDEGRQGGGRRRDSLTGRRIKICKGNYKGSIGIVSNVKGQSLHVQLQSTGKTVIGKFLFLTVHINRSEIKEDVDVTVPHRCGTRHSEPSTPSRTPLHPTMTPMRELEATQVYDGMRTPMRSRAWNPYALMTPERFVLKLE